MKYSLSLFYSKSTIWYILIIFSLELPDQSLKFLQSAAVQHRTMNSPKILLREEGLRQSISTVYHLCSVACEQAEQRRCRVVNNLTAARRHRPIIFLAGCIFMVSNIVLFLHFEECIYRVPGMLQLLCCTR